MVYWKILNSYHGVETNSRATLVRIYGWHDLKQRSQSLSIASSLATVSQVGIILLADSAKPDSDMMTHIWFFRVLI